MSVGECPNGIALDVDPRLQVSGAKIIDVRLEPLETTRDAAHDRVGTDGHGHREQAEHREPVATPRGAARHQPAPIGQQDGQLPPGAAS